MNDLKQWRYFKQDGTMARGLTKVVFKGKKSTQFFGDDGYQVKGAAIRDQAGHLRYFANDSGDMLTSTFAEIKPNVWIYLDSAGIAVTGKQTINGQELYFEQNGYQVKGRVVKDQTGNEYYYAADSGELQINYFEHLFLAQSESPNTFKVRQNDIPNVQTQNVIERKDIEKEISEQNIK